MPSNNDNRELSQQVEKLKEDLKELREIATRLAGDKLHDARTTVEGYYESGKTRAREFETDVSTTIRDHPLRSIFIASGVGLLLGALWSRK